MEFTSLPYDQGYDVIVDSNELFYGLVVNLMLSLGKFYCDTMTWLIVAEYLCPKWSLIIYFCRYHNLVLSSLMISITGFVTRDTQRVPLVEQELLTLPEHMSFPRLFIWVCVIHLSSGANNVRFIFTLDWLVHVLFMFFVFIYV
jgi:hypothetical protein